MKQEPASKPPTLTGDRFVNPIDLVTSFNRRFPDVAAQVDRLRPQYETGEEGYPPHWYVPYPAAADILLGHMDERSLLTEASQGQAVTLVSVLIAYSSWRVTQGIYRFEPTLLEALCATPVSGKMPVELLYRLPEWCVYLETSGLSWEGQRLRGVFAQVMQAPAGEEVLFLLLHGESYMEVILLRLDLLSLDDSIEFAICNGSAKDDTGLRELLPKLVSLLLYLCSEAAEIGDGSNAPIKPLSRRTKKATRMFPANKTTTWDVGIRIGAALKIAYRNNATAGDGDGQHAGPRPHIRRAHWHTFLTGPRLSPTRNLRWLPPIAVNVDDIADLVPTVRRVDSDVHCLKES